MGPDVAEKALAALVGDARNLGGDQQAVGVANGAAGFAIQLGLDGVHHHRALHVVDPEVFVVAIAHLGDGAVRHGLGLGAAQLALGLLLLRPHQHPAGRLYRLLHLGLALLQAAAVLLPHQCQGDR